MDKHAFLSTEWIAAARAIRSEQGTLGQPIPGDIRLNQVITEVPFGDGTIEAHIDTTSGQLEMELGHLEGADATVSMEYDTAKMVFVEGSPQVLMQAFMAGKVRVQGDLAKLIAAMQQVAPPDAETIAPVHQQIRDITA
ncbi:MAG: SCP2 sterol-binding domain-containing protein [Acidimicrobiales bacterium]